MSYEQTVEKLYIAYYGRPADTSGLAYWTDNLSQNGGSLDQMINAFASSPEAVARFGGLSQDAVVSAVYSAVLGHAPDQAGHDYYLNALSSGQISAGELALGILNGVQNADATALDNKVAAATNFTAQLAADPVKAANFTGEAAAAAQKMLDSITADSTAADLQKAVADTVQMVNDTPPVAHTDGTTGTPPADGTIPTPATTTDGTTPPPATLNDGTTPAQITPTDGTTPVPATPTDPAIIAALAGQQPPADATAPATLQSAAHVDTGAAHTDITVTGVSPSDGTSTVMH